jgi:hypothetical protein
MNMSSGQEPAEGPDYYGFADDTLYHINIDNDQDGVANDVVYELRFTTEHRSTFAGAGFPFPYAGNPSLGNQKLHGITALDGTGSEGLRVRQFYSVTEVRNGKRKLLFENSRLIAVPSYVGPVTMPSYEELAAQGIYRDVDSGIRIFAGQRSEPLYRDTGAMFDSLNLRRSPPFLTAEEDNNNFIQPFGRNRFSGANVQSIVIEIPIARVTRDAKPAGATAFPMLGAYASMSRRIPSYHGLASKSFELKNDSGKYYQVARMGNPTFRMLAVDTADRLRWDAAKPEHDAQFQESLKNPVFSQFLAEIVGLPVPPSPRLDLVQIIFKYPGQPLNGTDCGSPCADLLRINLMAPPTPAEGQHRLGALLSPDPAGFRTDVGRMMMSLISH